MSRKWDIIDITILCLTFYEPPLFPHGIFLAFKYLTILFLLVKYGIEINNIWNVILPAMLYSLVTLTSTMINKMAMNTVVASLMYGIQIVTVFLVTYVSKEYYAAWKYMPFLTVGCVYLTMASFMATSYTVHKDSFGYLFSGMFGAIFNVAMNFVLIPLIGVYGAAIATCISYILVFVFRLFHTRKYIRYNIYNKEFIVGSTILILSACMMFINNRIGFMLQLILLAVTVYLFSDVWLPIMEKMVKLKGRQ